MADDWQLEAVHEQFDVFHNLTEPYSNVEVTNIGEIISKISTIIRQHLRGNSKPATSLRKISAELIKVVPDEQNHMKLSYTVIVTNKDNNQRLCKFPVFTVVLGNQCVFVDINGSVYPSWNAFIKSNDLPACSFCYPVNGCYDVGGKLKIDFAQSPASTLQTRKWWIIGGVIASCVVVAASFYFRIVPTTFNFVENLIPIAEGFLPKILLQAGRHLLKLAKLCQQFRDGRIEITQFLMQLYIAMRWFFSNFKDEISQMWAETQKFTRKAKDYLYRKLNEYFESASSESQNEFLAITYSEERAMQQAEREASNQLNEVRSDSYISRITSSENTSNPTSAASVEDPRWVNTVSTITSSNTSYNEQIFQSCRDACALEQEIKKLNDENDDSPQTEEFSPTTGNLLDLSKSIANELQKTNLADVKCIFESVSCIIRDEYKHKVENYMKAVKAAREGAGHEIDLNAYNTSLGITGDPTDHFMKEAMNAIQEYRLVYQLKEKMQEIEKSKKILLFPIVRKSEDGREGTYRSIGIRGAGKFSVQSLLSALKELFIDLDESTLVVNETSSLIFIRSEEVSIVAYQELNDENTSDGLVHVDRNSN